jgi:hypothetical protein
MSERVRIFSWGERFSIPRGDFTDWNWFFDYILHANESIHYLFSMTPKYWKWIHFVDFFKNTKPTHTSAVHVHCLKIRTKKCQKMF